MTRKGELTRLRSSVVPFRVKAEKQARLYVFWMKKLDKLG